MKKLILFPLTLILAGHLSAQQGFYLKPLLEKKGYYKKDPVSRTIFSTGNQPFELNGQAYFWGLGQHQGAEVGILLGYNLKHITFETGLVSDGSNGILKLNYSTYNKTDSTYRTSFWKLNEGVALTKIPFRMYYNVFRKDSLHKDQRNFSLEGSIFAGLDFVFKPVGNPNTPLSTDEIDFLASNGKTITITETLYETPEHWDYLRTLGFNLKLYKRERNILNISVYGSWGHFNFSEIRFDMKNTDGTHYIHSEYAKADGIYVSLSKELNFTNTRNDFNRKFRFRRENLNK